MANLVDKSFADSILDSQLIPDCTEEVDVNTLEQDFSTFFKNYSFW